jgi:poly(A) polymerase
MADNDDFDDEFDVAEQYDDTRPCGKPKGGRRRAVKPDTPGSFTSTESTKPPAAISQPSSMPAVEHVFHQVQWDPRFDPNRVFVCYEDRFKGLMTTPFAKFRGGSIGGEVTIPLHRVRKILVDDNPIWDRDERKFDVSVVASGQHVEASKSSNLLAGMKGVKLAISPPEVLASTTDILSLRILNFNVLHDLFDAEKIYTPQRLPLIASLLERCDADIVMLQEVTTNFRDQLRGFSTKLRSLYYWTTLPHDVNTVQMTLSKFPITEAISFATSGRKRCVFAVLDINNRYVVTANCHLLSDFGNNPITRRIAEYGAIVKQLEKMRGATASVISGDFNFGDQNEEQQKLDWRDFNDAWLHVHDLPRVDETTDIVTAGHQPQFLSKVGGFTYDLTRNWLADIMSRGHRYPRRLDRTLVKGLIPVSCKIVGDEATAHGDMTLLPSDHFGLLTDCQFLNVSAEGAGTRIAAVPSYHTAIAVVLPESLWANVNAIRQHHDKAFARWPPHVTLLFPFVQPSAIDETVAIIDNELLSSGAAPKKFTMALHRTGEFPGKSTVLFLHADSPTNGFTSLYNFLANLFPSFRRETFVPHVTLGQFEPNEGDLAAASQQARKMLPSEEIVVDAFELLARDAETGEYKSVKKFALLA